MVWRRIWARINHEHGVLTTHFWGPVANWALVGSAVYDGTMKGPEVISPTMTCTMCIYSALFMRFAWAVQPRNLLLLSCHAFNEVAQLCQLYRVVQYKKEKGEKLDFSYQDAAVVGAGAVGAGALIRYSPVIQPKVAEALGGSAASFINHPAGPFTIFFWAPTTKWLLSLSNIVDWNRPVENISTSQQLALASTGLIWSRYSMVIIPVNYNLLVVNFVLALTSLYHISRKVAAAQNESPTATTA